MGWQTAGMDDDGGATWIVMVRDVSQAVRIHDQPRTFACLVLDADAGLARGVSAAASARTAIADAMRGALTRPAGPLPAQAPARVVCSTAHAEAVSAELADLMAGTVLPQVRQSPPVPEAEDTFDSLIGHLAGRAQPSDLPTPADWQVLYAVLHDYCRARVWLRRSDTQPLKLTVTAGGPPVRYVAVVMGQAGVQRGLALYPGDALPDASSGWEPGDPVPMPTGTLLLWLDPAGEVPAEYVTKAVRYGWAADADLFPLPLIAGSDGPADLDRRGAMHLTMAAAAVLADDHRPAGAGDGQRLTFGSAVLADGVRGTYTLG